MQTKNQVSLTRKDLFGVMLFGLFFSAFGAGNLSSVRAQGEETITATPEVQVQATITPTPEVQAQETSTPTPEIQVQGTVTPTPEVEAQIVGGTLADPGEYPWQVALVGGTSTDLYNGQFCGGSLIDSQWVLTAAHCITEDDGSVSLVSSLDVIAGIYNLQTPTAGYQRRDVIQIIRHAAYNSSTYDTILPCSNCPVQ